MLETYNEGFDDPQGYYFEDYLEIEADKYYQRARTDPNTVGSMMVLVDEQDPQLFVTLVYGDEQAASAARRRIAKLVDDAVWQEAMERAERKYNSDCYEPDCLEEDYYFAN